MKKAFMIYLDEDLHRKAKKRAIDLGINLSVYLANLIRKDLKDSKADLELTPK